MKRKQTLLRKKFCPNFPRFSSLEFVDENDNIVISQDPSFKTREVFDSESGRWKIGRILVFVNLGQTRLSLENEPVYLALNEKVENHENRIAALEKQVADLQLSVSNFQPVSGGEQNVFEKILGWLEDKVVRVKELVIGSPEKPSGMTLYDEETGEPYCVKIKGGQLIDIPGACGDQSQSVEVPPPDSEGQADEAGEGTISDTEPPVITLLGNNPAVVETGSTYSDLGITIQDNADNNLGYEVFRNGENLGWNISPVTVDTGAPAEHVITYIVTDNAGNTASSTRKVIVVLDFATTTPEQ